MLYLVASFLVTIVVTLLVVHSASAHAHLSGDNDKAQPQKFHFRVVPRIGGVGIVCGVLMAGGLALWKGLAGAEVVLTLLAAGAVAFGVGLTEDFTKRVSPLHRLIATAVSAALAIWLLGAVIERSSIPGLDTLLTIIGVPTVLTLLAVSGVAHSLNIIDGFNGLASMCSAIMFAALAYVAHQVGDMAIAACALAGLGAVLGFFVWNYPMGLIFLGDGGAYFLGFWIAELGILLVARNEAVSPLFPLLLCAYPIFETLFTMYRRRVVRGQPMGLPDATHLHSLVYRRLMRWAIGKSDATNMLRRNSMTAPYLWALCSLPVSAAVVAWDDGQLAAVALGLFCLLYVALYRSIVRFRTPRVLQRKGSHWAADVEEDEPTLTHR